ncbi:MAG: hypothetical protein WD651_11460 [Acidimicrobiia bacterium]
MAGPRLVAAILSVVIVGCSSLGGNVTTTTVNADTSALHSIPTGADTGPTTSSTSTTMAPITGYGDFSKEPYFEIDWFYVSELVVRCMNDRGLPATLTPDGAGISAANIPPDQNQVGYETMNACMEGLNVPPYEPPTEDQIALTYYYNLALIECLEHEGYQLPDPPSLEVVIETWTTGVWHPYTDVDTLGPEGAAIEAICPQAPVGGYGAWEPGDPVKPRPPN